MPARQRPDLSTRQPTSQVLHGLDWLASKSWVAAAVVIADLLWVAFSAWFSFPTRLETVFQTLVAAVTLAMVFVIQHTQARQQAVTQRKLDEILRALPEADNAFVTLENASDNTLKHAARKHRDVRAEAMEGEPPVQ
ncbi:MAG: low affinity iron permease family protein [Marmoricola sp.]